MSKEKRAADIEKYKLVVKEKLDQVDFVKVGAVGIAILLVLGAKGVFGPKVRIASILIINLTVVA